MFLLMVEREAIGSAALTTDQKASEQKGDSRSDLEATYEYVRKSRRGSMWWFQTEDFTQTESVMNSLLMRR